MKTSRPLLLAAGFAFAMAVAYPQVPPISPNTTPPPEGTPAPAVPGMPDHPVPDGKATLSGPSHASESFRAADTDLDGKISLDEFVAMRSSSPGPGTRSSRNGSPRADDPAPATRARNTPDAFRQLDVNKDGYLDPSEFAAFSLGESSG
ncbi:MAG TPA: EF-hand domain-containing protein [Lacunisphaera sp.]|nr:EF-hand domain-containing protein [Lacunisphaera sp.]